MPNFDYILSQNYMYPSWRSEKRCWTSWEICQEQGCPRIREFLFRIHYQIIHSNGIIIMFFIFIFYQSMLSNSSLIFDQW